MRIEVNLWRILNYTIHGADIIDPPHRVITVVRIFTITAILVRLFFFGYHFGGEIKSRRESLRFYHCISVALISLNGHIFFFFFTQLTMCEYVVVFLFYSLASILSLSLFYIFFYSSVLHFKLWSILIFNS